ncbi:hypothetical protein AB3G45_07885 [Shinella sp. S4-D37]|uniref:hypothetical protein n=1 Tax=Shinella sp. S4-D37 TaxID=3161999 RepID=UPI003466EBED
MRRAITESFCRAELERHVEEMIEFLDMLDGDPDLEGGGDADWSGYEDELPTRQWSSDGVAEAFRMIAASPAASMRADEYADTPRPPLLHDFRGGVGK